MQLLPLLRVSLGNRFALVSSRQSLLSPKCETNFCTTLLFHSVSRESVRLKLLWWSSAACNTEFLNCSRQPSACVYIIFISQLCDVTQFSFFSTAARFLLDLAIIIIFLLCLSTTNQLLYSATLRGRAEKFLAQASTSVYLLYHCIARRSFCTN